MALHKTQCPHCFTTYVISDEQYRVSEGMVRCGTCRERFQARLITDQAPPRFDPRKAFIEPLSEEPSADPEPEKKPLDVNNIEFVDPHSESPSLSGESEKPFSETDELSPDFEKPLADVEYPSIDHEESSTPFHHVSDHAATPDTDSHDSELIHDTIDDTPERDIVSETRSAEQALASIMAKQARDEAVVTPQQTSINDDRSANNIDESSSELESEETAPESAADTHQRELELPSREPHNDSSDAEQQPSSVDSAIEDTLQAQADTTVSADTPRPESVAHEQLIDEVDNLINDKLISAAPASASNVTTANATPQAAGQQNASTQRIAPQVNPALRAKPQLRRRVPAQPTRKRRLRWLLVPLMLGLIGVLGTLLLYQLWLKQIVVFPDKSRGERLMNRITVPLADELAKRDIALPVRRNLSQLELLSAQTEPHPTRASTILLRISLVNRASITQPLPWFELALTDSEGRLVSRRQLSPIDYIYNNNTGTQIGPKELKRITVELLAFPKQATGYELKLLNK